MRRNLPLENKYVELRGLRNAQSIPFVIFYDYFSDTSLMIVDISHAVLILLFPLLP